MYSYYGVMNAYYSLLSWYMVSRKGRKYALQFEARAQLSDYLISVGDVPVSAIARADAMHRRARERWVSRNSRRAEHYQVFWLTA